MGTLLIFVAPMLPFVWAAKLLAALVLFEVSAARVVVALKGVAARQSREEKATKKVTLTLKSGTLTPGHASPRKNDGMSLYQIKFVGFTARLSGILAQFALTHIRENSKLLTIIHPRVLHRMPEQ